MQDKKGADFLAIEVKNDNLLIFNGFNLFYLFWEERGYFHDKKRIVIKNFKNNNYLFLSLFFVFLLLDCFNDRI